MRLAALARRLAERAAAAEAQRGGAESEPAASASEAPSLYGSAAYWDARYATAAAPVDDSSRDEWCAPRVFFGVFFGGRRVGAKCQRTQVQR